jgi:hypothetical protein
MVYSLKEDKGKEQEKRISDAFFLYEELRLMLEVSSKT